VAKNVAAGNAHAFKVSGTGVVPNEALAEDSKAGAATATNRPGGGIGVPESTSDPLANYRWYILALAALVLAAGAFWITNRRPAASSASGGFSSVGPPFRPPLAKGGEFAGSGSVSSSSSGTAGAMRSAASGDRSALL